MSSIDANYKAPYQSQSVPLDPDQWTFIRLVSDVFEKVALPSIKNIVLTTRLEAGSGDYFSVLNGARAIKKVMSGVDIRVIVVASDQKIKSLPSVDLSEYCVSKVEFLPELSIENCKADLVVALPKDPLFRMWDQKWPTSIAHFTAEEYSKYSHFPDKFEVMGVSDASVGIFVPELKIASSFKDKRLDELFPDKEKPFFCYMRNPYYFWQFAIGFTKNSKEPLRIISPFPEKQYKKWYEDPSQNSFQKIDLSKFSKIEKIDFLTEGKIKSEIIYEGKEGKVLQIINPFPLDHSDFLLCASLSQSVVGCTGDISFSEMLFLSHDHMPYYEMLGHKRLFWAGMCDLAQKYKKEKAYHFLETLWQLRDSTYAPMNPELLRDPDLLKEMNEIKEIIKNEHNVEKFLIPLINRAILYAKYPKLKQIADDLFRQLKAKTIQLSELRENLSKAIQECDCR